MTIVYLLAFMRESPPGGVLGYLSDGKVRMRPNFKTQESLIGLKLDPKLSNGPERNPPKVPFFSAYKCEIVHPVHLYSFASVTNFRQTAVSLSK